MNQSLIIKILNLKVNYYNYFDKLNSIQVYVH